MTLRSSGHIRLLYSRPDVELTWDRAPQQPEKLRGFEAESCLPCRWHYNQSPISGPKERTKPKGALVSQDEAEVV